MAISVQNLFDSTADLYRLHFMAGKQGALRPVSWMYYTEDVSTLNFLRGGELVVTTGMEIGRHADNSGSDDAGFLVEYLSKLVKAVAEQNASGLILNIGKYIPQVPSEIEVLCESLNLPLFTMPWEIHIIDIMQDYGNRIVNDRQKGQSLEKSLFNAIFNPGIFNSVQLENTAFASAKQFSIVMLELPETLLQKGEDALRRYLDYSFNLKTGLHSGEYVCLIHENRILYIFDCDGHENAAKIQKAARLDKYFEKMKLAVSGTCSRAGELASEFRHADLAFKMCSTESLFCDYETLGVFQLLGEVQDRALLEKIYRKVLGQLDVFGKEKLTDYMNTLQLYLNSSGKVAKTAEENSTHRNTVNYRIRKICDTLGVDLADGETRYMIQTALYIRELLEKL